MVIDLYSIGYAGFCIKDFIDLLKCNDIKAVIDVRSIPYSKYYSDYNENKLQELLGKHNIYYRNYAKEFGAQQKDRRYYSDEGFLDFERFTASEIFISGFNKIKTSMEKNYTFVLMCSEKDPLECHRSIMVSRIFYTNGYRIKHLLNNGSIITQEDIENRLLNEYFPDRETHYQLSLFDKSTISTEELIAEAYRKKNSEIGYRLLEVKH